MTNTRFTLSNNQVVASVSDDTQSGSLFWWLGFSQNTSGNCIIKKVGGFNLNQTFYTVTRAVTGINEFHRSSTNLYVVYNDTTRFVERISLTNPLSDTSFIGFPSGVTESPVSTYYDGTELWVLTPGLSGNNARVLRYSSTLTLQNNIDLNKTGSTVTNAVSITVDSSSNVWVLTSNSPAEFVRVYDTGGSVYDFEVNSAL